MYQHIIRSLLGDLFEIDTNLQLREPSACRQRSTKKKFIPVDNLASRVDFDKDLFLWSVVMGQRDLNFLFWSRVKNKISA